MRGLYSYENMEEIIKILGSVIENNRLRVEFTGKEESYSYVVYRFKKLNKQGVTEKRCRKMGVELSSYLSYIPQVKFSECRDELLFYIRRDAPLTLTSSEMLFNGRDSWGDVVPVNIGRESSGEEYVFNLFNAPNILIGGDDGRGKSNLQKLIIEELKDREDISFVLVDITNTGEFEEYRRKPNCRVIDNKMDFVSYLFFRNNDLMAELESLLSPAEDREKTVFIINDMAPLLENGKDAEVLIAKLREKMALSWRTGFFSILALSGLYSTLNDKDFLEDINLIISFHIEDEEESKALIRDSDAQSLFHPGDAFCYNTEYREKTRVQCYKV